MKKTIALFTFVLLVACSSKKAVSGNALYQVLVASEYGGGNFEFYEIISQSDEFNILLSDDEIKKFVKPDDIKTANYVLVNLGEKNNGGYGIEVVSVEELSDKVIVTLKETQPKPGQNVTMALTNPYAVIKINSKKTIEIKKL